VERYQFKAEVGDVVIFPNGELGLVIDYDIYFGCSKVVCAYPIFGGKLRRLWWRLIGKSSFYDDQINKLVRLCSAKWFFNEVVRGCWFFTPNLWKVRLLATRELDREIGLVSEEDWREFLTREPK